MGLLDFVVILVMVGFNGVFAAYELALASVRPSRLKDLAEQKRRGARAAVHMKSRVEFSLAVAQLGLTMAAAIAAATGGANVGESLAPTIRHDWGLSKPMADFIALAIFVIPLSGLTIIVGELVPKIFALRNPERVCLLLSPAMWVLSAAAFPAVWALERTSWLLLRLIEVVFPADTRGDGAAPGLSELRAQVDLLRASKVIGLQEERIIVQASRLTGRKVGEIMLPAQDIVLLVADAPLTESIIAAHLDLHTRFPVSERAGDPQAIIGYINFKEMVYLAKTHPHNPSLREILRPLISFPVQMSVSDALRQMVSEHVHLALVRDAGGRVVGLVTQEDIFEELVGEIQDEFDRLPRQIVPSGKQWVVGGGATFGRLRQTLGRWDLGGAFTAETTLNDGLATALGRRARGGDTIKLDGVAILVRKVRRHHVTEALLDAEPSPASDVPPEKTGIGSSH